MKVVIIIGNAAVGKMTVGQELMKITGLRLFHNHMTIEPVIEIFGYYNKQARLRLQEVIFEEFAASACKGMIFTYMWAFDQPSDSAYMKHIREIFGAEAEFYYVELVASREIRLARNETENRLQYKASKRNLEESQARLLRDDEQHRLESREGEIPYTHYVKIDNSYLAPDVVARQIQKTFNL